MFCIGTGGLYYFDNGEAKMIIPPNDTNNIGNQLAADLSSIFIEQSFTFVKATGSAPEEPFQNCLDY